MLNYAPAADQAAVFLQWMQGPGGRTGYFPFNELAEAYVEWAVEHGLQPHPWAAIARELRRLVPQRKRYVGPGRVRMWHIPPSARVVATVNGQPMTVPASGERDRR